ncbi:flagellar motor switch protein FliN [Halomonas halmophila]|uniref:Flagellar motor switch protein FliN n=1 Tax=Halomonas halmophila TaxID=252 RepID=A0A4Y4F099_9GAMM|nr:flagellar motor switch protein FliN [Halomonas halmophila]GED22857.1 flagellar motor switch protein FliN [Halomonas halmophila]
MTDPNKPDKNVGDDDWADAMSEQEGDSASENAAEQADPWAEALAEQDAAEGTDTEASDASSEAARAACDSVFQPLEQGDNAALPRDLEMIMDIPVKLTVELGRTRLTIKQLLELAQGSVIELEGLAGEPMDILINGYLIAQGEVVVIEDKYGIRITEIITPSERVQKLNR